MSQFGDKGVREGIVLVKPVNTRKEECSLISYRMTTVLVRERVSLNYSRTPPCNFL
jgi:hypothetical protein